MNKLTLGLAMLLMLQANADRAAELISHSGTTHEFQKSIVGGNQTDNMLMAAVIDGDTETCWEISSTNTNGGGGNLVLQAAHFFSVPATIHSITALLHAQTDIRGNTDRLKLMDYQIQYRQTGG